ncbi:MAG TPA: hypothetical protein VG870_03840 [Chitinophagaceae bacterium]|nr:hypothetical protein [Chitinophagaceae bacterium]
MKKKILLAAGGLLTAALLILLLAPIRFYVKQTVHISAPIRIVSQQLYRPRNWTHWFPDLQAADSTQVRLLDSSATSPQPVLQAGEVSYRFLKTNPAEVFVRQQEGSRQTYHALLALPDSFGMATHVTWARSCTPLGWLLQTLNPRADMRTGLARLKSFAEQPATAYGFPIRKQPVTDTLVITSKTTTTRADRVAALRRLYGELRGYAARYQLHPDTVRMAAFNDYGDGTVEIMAGIPVRRRGPQQEGISYLNMPPHGKMLVGTYEGPYSGIPGLYEAMHQFIIDRALQQVAVNYEKYLTDPVTHQDSLHMRIELYYPIF